MKHLGKIWGIGLVLLACMSCEPDTVCHSNVTSTMKVHVKTVTILADSTQLFGVADSLTIGMIGTDSLVAKNAHNQSDYKVELNPKSDTTDLWLLYHGKHDTIRLYYSNDIYYVSMACGCAITHQLDSTTDTMHAIDSLIIVNTNVDMSEDTNLEIWLKN